MTTLGKRILIVDDEPDTVTFLRTWLEDQGYETCAAADGEQGLRAVIEQRPDLVLMDLRMPNQTGLQLYRELHLREELRELPVIFITGMGEVQIFDEDCALLPRPAAHIDKPIDLATLDHAIRQAFASAP